MVYFKIYDVTDWTANDYNTYINISRRKVNQAMKSGQSKKYSVRNIFLLNHAENEEGDVF